MRLFAFGLLFGLIPATSFPSPSLAQTVYFNPMPYQLSQGTLAQSSQVNGNFAQLVSDGNAAKAAIQSALSGVTGSGLPHGAVVAFQANNCPNGFQMADGSAGSPDVRGLVIRGLDNGAGRDPSRVLASIQGDAIGNHAPGGNSGLGGYTTVGTTGGSQGSAITTANLGSIPALEQSGGLTETRMDAVILMQCYRP